MAGSVRIAVSLPSFRDGGRNPKELRTRASAGNDGLKLYDSLATGECSRDAGQPDLEHVLRAGAVEIRRRARILQAGIAFWVDAVRLLDLQVVRSLAAVVVEFMVGFLRFQSLIWRI